MSAQRLLVRLELIFLGKTAFFLSKIDLKSGILAKNLCDYHFLFIFAAKLVILLKPCIL